VPSLFQGTLRACKVVGLVASGRRPPYQPTLVPQARNPRRPCQHPTILHAPGPERQGLAEYPAAEGGMGASYIMNARESGLGHAGTAGWRIRATMPVVDSPGTRDASSTRPPAACTMSAPTTWSRV
jgi:hypothetical protein